MIRPLAHSAAVDVLLAKSTASNASERSFVIRIIGEKYAQDERFGKAFTRAATAYARLSDPTIVRVHELFQFEGRLALVQEHVEGVGLNRLRGMLRAVGYGLDDSAAFHIAAECFKALAAAHASKDEDGGSAPCLHRYLRPSKVLIGWDGSVKVRDFGLPEATNPNQQNVIAIARGADGYMAPEQVNGKEVTPRSDVYGAALILWELLTKKRAFLRTKRQVEMWRAMAQPNIESLDVRRADIDERLRALLRKALEPGVEKRAVAAKEIASVLHELVPPQSGREYVTAMMAMIRHEPTPVLSDFPPEIPANEVSLPSAAMIRGSNVSPVPLIVPSVDSAASAVERPAAQVSVIGTNVSAAKVLDEARAEQPRISSAVLPAVRPETSAPPPPPKAMASGTRAATKAPPPVPRKSSGSIGAVRPPPIPGRLVTPPPMPVMPSEAPPPPSNVPEGVPSAFASSPKILVVDLPADDRAETLPSDAPAEKTIEVSASALEALPVEEDVARPSGASLSSVDFALPGLPTRSRQRTMVLVGTLCVAGVIGVGSVSFLRSSSRKPLASTATSSSASSEPKPAVREAAEAVPAAMAATTSTATPSPSAQLPQGMGLIKTSGRPNRRIFVDAHIVGQTPASVRVKCGEHYVKIGSSGHPRLVDIPCGGEIDVAGL